MLRFNSSESSGHHAIDYQYDFSIQDAANNPLMMDYTLEDPFYSSFYNLTPGDGHILNNCLCTLVVFVLNKLTDVL